MDKEGMHGCKNCQSGKMCCRESRGSDMWVLEKGGGGTRQWGGEGMMPCPTAGENMLQESWTFGTWLHKG